MIYADYNGSAPLLPKVRDYLAERLQTGPYGNPNAIHSVGKKMLFGMEKCRRVCAKALGATTNQVIFNSGASEGITQVFHTLLSENNTSKKPYIITSGIEHSAVVNACKYYADKKGHKVLTINTLKSGEVDLEHLEVILSEHHEQTAMLTVMAANNETGVIQPWKEIVKLAQKFKVPYFSDTTQYIGKTDFNFQESGMDYAVCSGHKFGALVGSGILLTKDFSTLKPLIFGGGQEKGFRGGTQNYIGNETMAIALEEFQSNKESLKNLKDFRLEFEASIKKDFPDVVIIGETANRLATTTLISYPGIHGQAVQIELESQDIFVTTSSACSDNEPETSKVLKAMGISDEVGRGVVRISLCCGGSRESYLTLASSLKAAYKKLSNIASY